MKNKWSNDFVSQIIQNGGTAPIAHSSTVFKLPIPTQVRDLSGFIALQNCLIRNSILVFPSWSRKSSTDFLSVTDWVPCSSSEYHCGQNHFVYWNPDRELITFLIMSSTISLWIDQFFELINCWSMIECIGKIWLLIILWNGCFLPLSKILSKLAQLALFRKPRTCAGRKCETSPFSLSLERFHLVGCADWRTTHQTVCLLDCW